MADILLIVTVGTMCIVSFLIGAKVGQTVVKGEDIQTPNLNPLEHIQKHREKKEAEREKSRVETILENIENYDGTGYGQKDVPR